MGRSRQGRCHPHGGRALNATTARVVPNVPSFSVDSGFWYSVPEQLPVGIGSIVRVPLGGRRVRGWVVETGGGPESGLKPISGVSGGQPVFDAGLLRSLSWAASHYVAPLSVVLTKATPPNLPKALIPRTPTPIEAIQSPGPLEEIAEATAGGRRMPTTALVGAWQSLTWVESLVAVLSAGSSVLIIAATTAEVQDIAEASPARVGDRVVALATDEDAEVTRAWESVQHPGCLLIATPRAAFWQIGGLSLAVVLEEGRRAMKDRQTPTVHVREMMRTRSRIEGFNLAFFGPTPSLELLAAGANMARTPGRPWSHIEVVDRSGEAPGAGLLSDQATSAIRATLTGSDARVFVLTGHKMTEKIAVELNQRLGTGSAAVAPTDARVVIGTERDLAGIEPMGLTVVPDADFLLSGTGYRASEEALRQLARLGNAVGRGRGRRMIVQTRRPGSPLLGALRRGDPVPYLESVLMQRAREQLPPSVEMIAIEIRGDLPEGVGEEIVRIAAGEVLGPMKIDGGARWLISGDLRVVRRELRGAVGRWRERGATVRVDVDPIDF